MAEVKSAPPAVASPAIGTIVSVRSSINSRVPAIVTNDFAGQNAPGVVSLVVFNAASFDGQATRVIPAAQAETTDIAAEDLARELFLWWHAVDSNLAKRDLQKEIDSKRAKSN